MMKSLEVGYWVDEEPYELSDAFPAAQVFTQYLYFLLAYHCSHNSRPLLVFLLQQKRLTSKLLPPTEFSRRF